MNKFPIVTQFDSQEVPKFLEKKNKNIVWFGVDNMYPYELIDLYNDSSTHNAIINGKVGYTVGNGLESEDLETKKWLSQANIDQDWTSLMKSLSLDYEIFNGYAIEVIKTKVGNQYHHIDFANIRVGLDGSIQYADDWITDKGIKNYKPDIQYLERYNPRDPEQKRGVIYHVDYRPNLKYYPLPVYVGSLAEIKTDVQIGDYWLNEVENGFVGGTLIQHNNGVPETKEEAEKFEKSFQEKFGKSTGTKIVHLFAPSKDNGSEITSLNGNDLHERYIEMSKRVKESIFIGHRVTNPILFGVKEEGQLGARNELDLAYEIFTNTYIAERQNTLLRTIKKLAFYEIQRTDIEIIPLKPIDVIDLTSDIILANLDREEIRELINDQTGLELKEETQETGLEIKNSNFYNQQQKRDSSGRWVKENNLEEYRGTHQISYDPDFNTTVNNLTKDGNLIPMDIFDNPQWYADMNDESYQESWEAIKKLQGNPNMSVTIYRGVPKGVKNINSGDWVSLSKTYALRHSYDMGGKGIDGSVISKVVKAKNIVWDGNDINEFAFFDFSKLKNTFASIVKDGKPLFDTIEEAERVAKEIGCEGYHEHNIEGKTWYMPCSTHSEINDKNLEGFDAITKFETYNDYPKAASKNAQTALNWAEKNGWGSCLEASGKKRANQLAKRDNISRDTIARMAAFERHRKNSKKKLGDGCGRLAWLAWGGDEGVAWAQRKLKQIDAEKMSACGCFSNDEDSKIIDYLKTKGVRKAEYQLLESLNIHFDVDGSPKEFATPEQKEKRSIIRILKDNPKTTAVAIATALGLSFEKIVNYLLGLTSDGIISSDESELTLTNLGDKVANGINIPKAEIKYQYQLRSDAPPLKKDENGVTIGESRDFCTKMMEDPDLKGKYWSKAEIEGMSNDMAPDDFSNASNVWLARGGWYQPIQEEGEVKAAIPYCRHEWNQVIVRKKENFYDKNQKRGPDGRWITESDSISSMNEILEYPMEKKGLWYGDEDYKARGGELVYMSPDEFLSKAKPLLLDYETKENVDYLAHHIKIGKKLDPLAIYSIDRNDVKASDGRHRALAAKKLNIKKVPVLDFTIKKEYRR